MKRVFIFSIVLVFIFSFSSLSAQSANLEIDKQVITDTVIVELSQPARYNFSMTNHGSDDYFELYSFVGIDIIPRAAFEIKGGETKSLVVELYPDERVKKNREYYTFIYNIKGQSSGIIEDKMRIKLVELADAFRISVADIDLNENLARLYIENKEKFYFDKINARFVSAFFDYEADFSLAPLETKEFIIDLDKKKIEGLMAGEYMLTSTVKVENVEREIESNFRFVEKRSLSLERSVSGILTITELVERKNTGNVPVVADVSVRKNIISRLFTSFSIEPDGSRREGFYVYYDWRRELRPGETLKLSVKTGWLFPFVLLMMIVFAVFLIRFYTSSYLRLSKRVVFVKTKGGEFALKVILSVKARKRVENVRIIDKLPLMVKIYERFGVTPPDRIDEKNRRLEWNIESLNIGEERVFSYIIYSKVGVLGRFELPASIAVFERQGKVHEVSSNKTFFVAEQRRKEERIE